LNDKQKSLKSQHFQRKGEVRLVQNDLAKLEKSPRASRTSQIN